MIIRPVTLDDFPLVQEIKPQITKPSFDSRLAAQNKGDANFYILLDNNSPVSFVFLKFDGKPTHPEYPDIEDLYTKESYRGKGFGTTLLKHCELKAQEKGFTRIGLAVNPVDNPHAKRLYERLGYRHDGKDRYVDGIYNDTKDWVIDMEKTLAT